jgi:hypothetical protein
MPPTPFDPPPLGWSEAEAELGVTFPADFKAFVTAYGLGGISPALSVLDPRSITYFRSVLEAYTGPIDYVPWDELHGPPPPLHAYPGDGDRLLSVCVNVDADAIYMVLRDGVADDDEYWIGSIENGDWQRMKGPFCQILLDLLTATDRRFLGEFDYWAWHLEPIWVAAPDSAQQ